MMAKHYTLRSAGAAVLAVAICIASCSSEKDQPPAMAQANTQASPASTEFCQIDAIKMCQAEGGSTDAVSQQATKPMTSYGPPNIPESLEFQIPAGQAVKLMCYYDPQHTSVYRADATAQAPLTGSSIAYMKKQGFCTNK